MGLTKTDQSHIIEPQRLQFTPCLNFVSYNQLDKLSVTVSFYLDTGKLGNVVTKFVTTMYFYVVLIG